MYRQRATIFHALAKINPSIEKKMMMMMMGPHALAKWLHDGEDGPDLTDVQDLSKLNGRPSGWQVVATGIVRHSHKDNSTIV